MVSLDGHGADELMGGYSQVNRSLSFRLRNLLARLAPAHSTALRVSEVARSAILRARRQEFLRRSAGGAPVGLPTVGDQDELPEAWGAFSHRLYRMFHGRVLPTILRNFDRLSMAHGVEVRMPFLDWRLVTYTMALPDSSKNRDGFTKFVARQAMQGRMPESIRMQKIKVGFNSPMPTWLNDSLTPWLEGLIERSVPAFAEIIDEAALYAEVRRLSRQREWAWVSAGRIWPYLHLKWLLACVT